MAEKNSFVVYQADGAFFELLDDKDCKVLITAMFAYARGEEPELTEKAAVAFKSIKEHMDFCAEKYQKAVEQRRKAIESRWKKAKENTEDNTEIIRDDTAVLRNDTNTIRNDTDKDKDKDNDKDKVNVNDKEEEKEKEKEKENDNANEEDKDNDKSSSMSSSSLSSCREDYSRVIFSDEDKEELFNMSDRQQIERYIDRISAWQQENRRFMKDPCRTIKKWLREDGRKPGYYDRGYQGYSGGSYGYRNHTESEREKIDREAKELARKVAEFEATLDFDTLST